jgi:serine kinase of HPr protein (carbohydrate metabolism regulator)
VIEVHGTTVALDGKGVLLRGRSGAGKSDLALRLIDAGGVLVADDRTVLVREEDRLVAAAPATIAGQLEVRGIGIVVVPIVAAAPLRLVVDLVASDAVERLPERATALFLGVAVPRVDLAPFEASAAAKLRLAVRTLGE